MKKITRLVAAILAINMLLSSSVLAAEGAQEFLSSDAALETVDVIKNTIKEVGHQIKPDVNIGDVKTKPTKKVEAARSKKQWDGDDIKAMYQHGYSMADIKKAMDISATTKMRPFELLEKKGKPQYKLRGKDDQTLVLDKVNEKSWKQAQAEASGDEIAASDDIQFIKENGLLEFIDPSVLSEEEIDYISTTDETAVPMMMSLNTNSSADLITDEFNNSIFPQIQYKQYNAGMEQQNEDVTINPITKNAIVRATDLTLKGKNGLDLNLTRVNSTQNSGEEEPVKIVSGGAANTSNLYFCYVYGNADVTIGYRETLPNGKKEETFQSKRVVFKPFVEKIGITTNYQVGSLDAIAGDLELLRQQKMPNYMFSGSTLAEAYAAADIAAQAALNGKYNTKYIFSFDSKISYIEFNIIQEERYIQTQMVDDDPFLVTQLNNGWDVYLTSTVNDTVTDKYFDIGLGWEFDFPYIEKRYVKSYDEEATNKNILHFGSKGVWEIEGTTLVDYPLNDIQVSYGGSFNGQSCECTIAEKDGKKYYFGNLGQLLGIEDRFGNNIKFEYTTKTSEGHLYPYRLTKIIDTVGREITFDYSNAAQTIVTVVDKNDSTQNKVIKYNKQLSNETSGVYLLTSVLNAENQETTYTYKDYELKVSFSAKNFDEDYDTITHHVLSKISKPSGEVIELNTTKQNMNVGNDGLKEGVIVRSYNIQETSLSNPSKKYVTFRHSVSTVTTFNHDGYPKFGYISEIPVELVYETRISEYEQGEMKDTIHEYTRSEKDNWMCQTSSTSMMNSTTNRYVFLERSEFTYNDKEQCIKEIFKTYNQPDQSRTQNIQLDTIQSVTTEYTYDSAGYNDILKIKRFDSDEYSISYEYDSTYHIPTKKTYKKDANTTIIENYTLTPDKKAVSSAVVTANNATKKKLEYGYDTYGNVTSEKRYTGLENWTDYVQIDYNYDDLTSRANKLNGVYLGKVSVSGVKDVDGSYVGSDGTIESIRTYDWYGNIITETDQNSNVYSYAYDKLNRPLAMTNPTEGQIAVQYNTECNNNYVTVTNENGNVMKYYYSDSGRMYKTEDVTANKTLQSMTYGYHETDTKLGTTKTVVTDYSEQGNNRQTLTAIDSLGRIVEKIISDSDGNVLYKETYEYTAAIDQLYSCVTKTVQGETEDKNYTQKQYTDKFGSVVKEEIIYQDGAETKTLTTEYAYDYLGNCISVKSPRAISEGWTDNVYTTQYEYDIDGQVTKATDIYGNFITNEYDALGRLVRTADAESTASSQPYYTTYTYDILGRLLKEETPLDSNTYAENRYYYDNNGNVTKTMTKNSSGYSETVTEYDWRNQPTRVLTDGTDSAYYYDAVGNVLRAYTGELDNLVISGLDNVSGADFEVTKYTYDTQNRPLSVTDALGNTEYNTYDINGALISTTDRNGSIISYTYNPMGNLTAKSAKAGADAEAEDVYTYVYNRLGLVTSMTGAGVTTTYTYNNIGQLVREEHTTGEAKTYTYDANGNKTSFTLTKDGVQQINTAYTYDKLDRLETVTNGTNVSSYTYDRNGRLAGSTTNGFVTSYAYNLGGLVSNLSTEKNGTPIQSYSYQYRPDGTLIQKQATVNGQNTLYSYAYDNAGRLTREQANDSVTTYTYDAYSNRAGMTSGDVSYVYSYDKNNRLLNSIKTEDGTEEHHNYTYDRNGNTLSWTKSTYTNSNNGDAVLSLTTDGTDFALYGYDRYNRLTSYNNGVTNASYTYDGNNLRLSKTVNGVTTNHIWDGSDIVMDTTGTTVNKYYRGATGIEYADINGATQYFHKDEHGNVATLTDTSGTEVSTYLYDAFGNQLSDNTNDTNPFRYSGEYYDSETGSIYLRNRYYAPAVGRFITEDPIRDGLNWYVYCGNNPVMFVDIWGLAPTKEEAAYMAEHIYGDYDMGVNGRESRTVAGWRLIDVFDGGSVSSIKVGIYIPDEDDWTNPTEYALVFRGSTTNFDDLETWGVWTNNLLAYDSSYSIDMWTAIGVGIYFDATHSQEITFVGHSKGGGEAIAAATATNNNAITFNAANFDFSNYGLVEKNKSGITNYYIKGEILSSIIGVSRYGTNIPVATQYWNKHSILGFDFRIPAPVRNHDMDAFRDAWGLEW